MSWYPPEILICMRTWKYGKYLPTEIPLIFIKKWFKCLLTKCLFYDYEILFSKFIAVGILYF